MKHEYMTEEELAKKYSSGKVIVCLSLTNRVVVETKDTQAIFGGSHRARHAQEFALKLELDAAGLSIPPADLG